LSVVPSRDVHVDDTHRLAITPDRQLALVANSLDWVKDGDAWKGVPDNKIYVIDLTATRQRVDADKISQWM